SPALSSLSPPPEPKGLHPFHGPSLPDPDPPALTPADRVVDLLSPQAIQMQHVAGTFVFTQDGISVEGVTGRLENNGFKVSGQVGFGKDPVNGLTWVSLHDVRGRGAAGGPNQDGTITVNGWLGPIGPGLPPPGLCFRVRGDDVASEPLLMAAFDPDVRTALAL